MAHSTAQRAQHNTAQEAAVVSLVNCWWTVEAQNNNCTSVALLQLSDQRIIISRRKAQLILNRHQTGPGPTKEPHTRHSIVLAAAAPPQAVHHPPHPAGCLRQQMPASADPTLDCCMRAGQHQLQHLQAQQNLVGWPTCQPHSHLQHSSGLAGLQLRLVPPERMQLVGSAVPPPGCCAGCQRMLQGLLPHWQGVAGLVG